MHLYQVIDLEAWMSGQRGFWDIEEHYALLSKGQASGAVG